MYGDRLNQLDFRVGKVSEVRSDTYAHQRRPLQLAELERSVDLQQQLRSRRNLAAAADGYHGSNNQVRGGDYFLMN